LKNEELKLKNCGVRFAPLLEPAAWAEVDRLLTKVAILGYHKIILTGFSI
jgi:hypothetical protein